MRGAVGLKVGKAHIGVCDAVTVEQILRDVGKGLARKADGEEVDDATLAKYTEYGSPEYNAMVEEIRKQLNLTTLKFQKLPKLLEAIGIDPDKVCTYCWTGKDVE